MSNWQGHSSSSLLTLRWCANFSFSLRGLSVLGVSAVSNRFKYVHRGDAENAEVAQRTGGALKQLLFLRQHRRSDHCSASQVRVAAGYFRCAHLFNRYVTVGALIDSLRDHFVEAG